MAGAIVNMFKVKELRERLFFTLMIVAVYRIGCVLTVPGIDANAVFPKALLTKFNMPFRK